MKTKLLAAGALALAVVSVPAAAQMQSSSAQPMTAQDVGVSPMTGTAPADYVRMAAESDMYEMQSSRLAQQKSKNPQVKQYARDMIRDHTKTTNALMATVRREKMSAPPKQLSADNTAKVAQLRAASGDQFDQMYLQQQMDSHKQAWALHSGFAQDGSDPGLKQVAQTAVPIVEEHIRHLKAMPGASAGTQ